MKPTLALCGLALFALPGCLGSSNSLAQLLVDTVETMETFESQTTTMPTSGSATYTGSVIGFTAASTLATEARVIAGEAEMQADFTSAGGTVSGTLSNFQANDNVDRTALDTAINTGDTAAVDAIIDQFEAIDGEIAITDGVITGTRYVANVSGTLTHGSDEITVDGKGSGNFAGTDADGIKFYTDSDLTEGADFAVNGSPTAGMLYVNAAQ